MGSSSQQVVEHVVLFKAKEPAELAATEAWAEAARALACLEGVLHLHVGAVRSCKPYAGAWSFALYGRYRDKAALEAYAVHPEHLQVVSRGSTLFSDVMAVDWEAPVDPSVHISPASTSFATPAPVALRVIFLQWKPNCPHEDIICKLRDQPLSTSGPNFSPGRARGFEWGSVSLYQGEDEPQEDDVCLQMLSESAAVEKFLIVDIDTGEARGARKPE